MMKNVLVVDDDSVMLRLYEFHLKRNGYNPILFSDGQEVLAKAALLDIDLAILDYLLPGRSGLEIIQAFKRNPRLSSIPCIVISGQGNIKLSEELRENGADTVFSKPFSPVLLIRKVNELLGENGNS